MDDSGAILLQISTLKDMLDKVNDEIEANIQITREIESEIVKIEEIENALGARESELMKLIYLSQFELSGLITVTDVLCRAVLPEVGFGLLFVALFVFERLKIISEHSVLMSVIQTCYGKSTKDLKTVCSKASLGSFWLENFSMACDEFQKNIESEDCNKLRAMLLEKESLEDEIHELDQTGNKFKVPVKALSEDMFEDLYRSNPALATEIQERQAENEQVLKEIEELGSILLFRHFRC